MKNKKVTSKILCLITLLFANNVLGMHCFCCRGNKTKIKRDVIHIESITTQQPLYQDVNQQIPPPQQQKKYFAKQEDRKTSVNAVAELNTVQQSSFQIVKQQKPQEKHIAQLPFQKEVTLADAAYKNLDIEKILKTYKTKQPLIDAGIYEAFMNATNLGVFQQLLNKYIIVCDKSLTEHDIAFIIYYAARYENIADILTALKTCKCVYVDQSTVEVTDEIILGATLELKVDEKSNYTALVTASQECSNKDPILAQVAIFKVAQLLKICIIVDSKNENTSFSAKLLEKANITEAIAIVENDTAFALLVFAAQNSDTSAVLSLLDEIGENTCIKKIKNKIGRLEARNEFKEKELDTLLWVCTNKNKYIKLFKCYIEICDYKLTSFDIIEFGYNKPEKLDISGDISKIMIKQCTYKDAAITSEILKTVKQIKVRAAKAINKDGVYVDISGQNLTIPDIVIEDRSESTALVDAVSSGNKEEVVTLLEQCKKAEKYDKYLLEAAQIDKAFLNSTDVKILKLLRYAYIGACKCGINVDRSEQEIDAHIVKITRKIIAFNQIPYFDDWEQILKVAIGNTELCENNKQIQLIIILSALDEYGLTYLESMASNDRKIDIGWLNTQFNTILLGLNRKYCSDTSCIAEKKLTNFLEQQILMLLNAILKTKMPYISGHLYEQLIDKCKEYTSHNIMCLIYGAACVNKIDEVMLRLKANTIEEKAIVLANKSENNFTALEWAVQKESSIIVDHLVSIKNLLEFCKINGEYSSELLVAAGLNNAIQLNEKCNSGSMKDEIAQLLKLSK